MRLDYQLEIYWGMVQDWVNDIQEVLNYEHCSSEHFTSMHGLGRTGVSGSIVGAVFGFHLALLLSLLAMGGSSLIAQSLIYWSLYMVMLCAFHFLEFLSTALHQPSSLNGNSFLINHSHNYTIAALCSWIEYWLEVLLLGHRKFHPLIAVVGFMLVLGGQVIRTIAMYHCGDNFSHQIAVSKSKEHKLVTDGIYKYLRHPSYFGWFYWSIGTQVLLMNPICTILYALISWKFFRERVLFEERILNHFFGVTYEKYSKRTWIGIPFI